MSRLMRKSQNSPQALPQNQEGLRTTVWKLKREAGMLEIEQLLLQKKSIPEVTVAKTTKSIARLDGIPGKIQGILERKGQVILYGPPGTGKTYWARRAARDLASLAAFGQAYDQLPAEQQAEVDGTPDHDGLVRCCTFHPQATDRRLGRYGVACASANCPARHGKKTFCTGDGCARNHSNKRNT